MPVPKNQRQPKAKEAVSSKQIKTGADPESLDKQTIAWQFFRCDRPHNDWGWDKLHAPQWKIILAHLVSFEGLTWAEIKAQAGGKKHGTNHHSLQAEKFTKAAQDRLAEIHLDDYETIFSLRINNTLRLYGIRDGRVFQIVWHDPHHGSAKGAYPISKK